MLAYVLASKPCSKDIDDAMGFFDSWLWLLLLGALERV